MHAAVILSCARGIKALFFNWIALFVATLALPCAPAAASVEIAVAPLRAVLTADADEAVIRVSNPSNRIIDLRVGWADLAAEEKGYAPASANLRATLSAAPYLSVEPAFMRLEPGADIHVTVRLRDTELDGAARGAERRSHLLFTTAAARTPLRKAGGGLEADIGLGVSIPVHVRVHSGGVEKGLAKTRAKFTETQLTRTADGDLAVETRIARSGPYSVYGRLEAHFEARDGAVDTIGALDNVAVHTENDTRLFEFTLGADELPEGVLTLIYKGRGEYEGRVFARKKFAISAPE